jgi:phage baseplate assembly protein W
MSIKITSLKKSEIDQKSTENGYLYKDINFDLEPQYFFNNQLNRKEKLKDVQAIFDIESVKNSIANCFTTSPGQKILNPTFGIDLRRFLFEPINKYTAEVIKDDIISKLPKMEPRVSIQNLRILAEPDNNEYEIYLQINVPSLNITGLSIKSKLNTNGYSIL